MPVSKCRHVPQVCRRRSKNSKKSPKQPCSTTHNGERVQGGLVKAYWTPKRLNCAEKQHVLQMIKSYSKQTKQTKRSARKKAPSKRLAGYEVYGTAKKARKK